MCIAIQWLLDQPQESVRRITENYSSYPFAHSGLRAPRLDPIVLLRQADWPGGEVIFARDYAVLQMRITLPNLSRDKRKMTSTRRLLITAILTTLSWEASAWAGYDPDCSKLPKGDKVACEAKAKSECAKVKGYWPKRKCISKVSKEFNLCLKRRSIRSHVRGAKGCVLGHLYESR